MLHTVSITDSEALDRALEALNSGSTLIYPTETCYGLGCDARNNAAVERILKLRYGNLVSQYWY
jgi:tRNA A37 threonylcarbamoyladenosine synthetase subunit TsaC/SUA5/YrdC